MTRLLAAAPALLLSACAVSLIGPEQPLAAHGEAVTVTLDSGARRTGELLAVTLTALILKEEAGFVSVDLLALRKVVVDRYERTERHNWNRLRPFCRYAQGVTEEQWGQLLQAAGQDDFIRVPPSGR